MRIDGQLEGWDLKTLAQVVSARHVMGACDVLGVALDSRLTIDPGAIFVALVGPRFDAHDHLKQAREQGASMVLVQDTQSAIDAGFEYIIEVQDTTVALQAWAAAHRRRFDVPVVGITGSNGKTIVKEMLASILARSCTVYRSPGSFNSQIGVALTLLGIRAEHQAVVVEAGISRPGEMSRLAEMIDPTIGVLLNIGQAHAAGLIHVEQTFSEKAKLFHVDHCETIIAPVFDPVVVNGFGQDSRIVWFSDDRMASQGNVFAKDLMRLGAMWSWTVVIGTTCSFEVQLKSAAVHDVANAQAAIAAANAMGVCVGDIQAGLAAWDVSPMRVEIHTTPRQITLINDAYSADPTSARHALQTLMEHAGSMQRKLIIMGDMLDLGELAPVAHRALGREIALLSVSHLFCVGEYASVLAQSAIEHGMSASCVHTFESLSMLQQTLSDMLEPQDVVLFKGSRALGLDRVATALLESVGPTRMFVDLGAISSNYHAVKRRIGPETKLMAVVKSYGYGNDATRISKALVREGVDALAVAYADEGIPLREAGLTLPIVVTNTLAQEADKLIRYDLTGIVYSKPVAQALAYQAKRANKRASVHVKVDTGMNRAGLRPEHTLEFVQWLVAQPNLALTGMMTHFASADEDSQDTFTHQQMRAFDGVLNQLKQAGISPGCVHAANTSAAWRFRAAKYDMVRVGLGLYGVHPSQAVAQSSVDTKMALKFVTRVIHVHDVEVGEGVGYGQTWRATRRSTVATIAVGYNDGFPRAMSNGGQVLVRGQIACVVGRVCMDVCVLDVSEIEGVCVGDEVVLFGRQGDKTLDVGVMANRAQTISYEILCNISPRVRRIFVHQS